MAQQLHVTSLGSFSTCPYKYKFDISDVDISKTFPGDCLNIAMVSKGDVTPFLDYFTKNFDGDFKQSMMLKKIYESGRDYINQLKIDYPKNYQETKFAYKVNNDLILVGTPDFFYRDENEQIFIIVDWKSSANFNWYKGNDIREESFQPLVYSLFVCEYFNVNKVKFKYEVFSKGNGERQSFERPDEIGGAIFTREEVLSKVIAKVNEFEESQLTEVRKPLSCRYCNFCPLRKSSCPLYNKRIETNEEI